MEAHSRREEQAKTKREKARGECTLRKCTSVVMSGVPCSYKDDHHHILGWCHLTRHMLTVKCKKQSREGSGPIWTNRIGWWLALPDEEAEWPLDGQWDYRWKSPSRRAWMDSVGHAGAPLGSLCFLGITANELKFLLPNQTRKRWELV